MFGKLANKELWTRLFPGKPDSDIKKMLLKVKKLYIGDDSVFSFVGLNSTDDKVCYSWARNLEVRLSILKQLPNLISLHLYNSDRLSKDRINSLLSTQSIWKNLRCLSLSGLPPGFSPQFCNILSQFGTQLVELALPDSGLRYQEMHQLFLTLRQHCHELRILNLSNNQQLFSNEVDALPLPRLPFLTKLSLQGTNWQPKQSQITCVFPALEVLECGSSLQSCLYRDPSYGFSFNINPNTRLKRVELHILNDPVLLLLSALPYVLGNKDIEELVLIIDRSIIDMRQFTIFCQHLINCNTKSLALISIRCYEIYHDRILLDRLSTRDEDKINIERTNYILWNAQELMSVYDLFFKCWPPTHPFKHRLSNSVLTVDSVGIISLDLRIIPRYYEYVELSRILYTLAISAGQVRTLIVHLRLLPWSLQTVTELQQQPSRSSLPIKLIVDKDDEYDDINVCCLSKCLANVQANPQHNGVHYLELAGGVNEQTMWQNLLQLLNALPRLSVIVIQSRYNPRDYSQILVELPALAQLQLRQPLHIVFGTQTFSEEFVRFIITLAQKNGPMLEITLRLDEESHFRGQGAELWQEFQQARERRKCAALSANRAIAQGALTYLPQDMWRHIAKFL